MASEHYALILGIDNNEKTLMKAICYVFPLKKYIEVLNTKSSLLEKYILKEKLDYIKIAVTNDDKFYKQGQLRELIKRECLRDPELLKKYLTNVWFHISKNQDEMINNKIFTSKDEIEEFLSPVLTLIGIISVATEMNCKKVTWTTMKY